MAVWSVRGVSPRNKHDVCAREYVRLLGDGAGDEGSRGVRVTLVDPKSTCDVGGSEEYAVPRVITK